MNRCLRLVISAGAIALTALTSPVSLGLPKVAIEKTTADFGTVEQGSQITKTFSLSNTGDTPLEIRHIEVSAFGMKVRTRQHFAPGESGLIKLNWDTRRYTGSVEERAIIHLSDPNRPKLQLTLKGHLQPPIDIKPRPAFYLSQFQGENRSRKLVIENHQPHPVNITRLEARGAHFIPNLKTLDSGKRYALTAEIPKKVPVGKYRESLILHTDDPKHPRISVEVNILVKPDLHIQPAKADFGHVQLSKARKHPQLAKLLQQQFVIKRRTGRMTIRSISSDIPSLLIDSGPMQDVSSFALNAGLDLAQLSPGPISGSIVLTTNDPDHPTISIPVSGFIAQ